MGNLVAGVHELWSLMPQRRMSRRKCRGLQIFKTWPSHCTPACGANSLSGFGIRGHHQVYARNKRPRAAFRIRPQWIRRGVCGGRCAICESRAFHCAAVYLQSASRTGYHAGGVYHPGSEGGEAASEYHLVRLAVSNGEADRGQLHEG